MDASKPLHEQIEDLRSMWRELWWAMAKGQKSEYDRIKLTPVFEFWKIFDLWKAQTAKELESLKQRAAKNKK